jgi:cation:H+ antiporter
MDYALIAFGLVLLIAGGEFLVRGASSTALRLGMSPLLVGLTLVGFGTSAPELVTSVQASLLGSPGIAIGNIVGSNIANVLLILGLAAAVAPITVGEAALVRDGVIVVVTAAVFCAVGLLLPFDRPIGAVFLAGLTGYLAYAYRQEKAGASTGHTAAFDKLQAHDELDDTRAHGGRSRPVAQSRAAAGLPLAVAIFGLFAIILGARLLVEGATSLARHAGVSDTVVGLTIVAIGTSLPELVTCLIAALRRHGDVALGAVLGSNIYNTLGIGGTTALIAPTVIPKEIARFDSLIMLTASCALMVFAWTGRRIGRAEGIALLATYVTYLIAVWPNAGPG